MDEPRDNQDDAELWRAVARGTPEAFALLMDRLGPRFPDMSRAYCPRLGEIADRTALSLGLRLERGVYAGVLGPNLETPAETRMLRWLGADAVGMSTVTEVIAARHLGLETLAISCLTNVNLPDCMAETTLEDVLATAK